MAGTKGQFFGGLEFSEAGTWRGPHVPWGCSLELLEMMSLFVHVFSGQGRGQAGKRALRSLADFGKECPSPQDAQLPRGTLELMALGSCGTCGQPWPVAALGRWCDLSQVTLFGGGQFLEGTQPRATRENACLCRRGDSDDKGYESEARESVLPVKWQVPNSSPAPKQPRLRNVQS